MKKTTYMPMFTVGMGGIMDYMSMITTMPNAINTIGTRFSRKKIMNMGLAFIDMASAVTAYCIRTLRWNQCLLLYCGY